MQMMRLTNPTLLGIMQTGADHYNILIAPSKCPPTHLILLLFYKTVNSAASVVFMKSFNLLLYRYSFIGAVLVLRTSTNVNTILYRISSTTVSAMKI